MLHGYSDQFRVSPKSMLLSSRVKGGLNEFNMLSHEASIIASKERAEMKMIEFFIPTKLSLTALDIQSRSAVSRKRTEIADSGTWASCESFSDQFTF